MLTIGTDTYISIADAAAYIEKHYISTAEKRTAWEAAEEEDKEILLRNAAVNIDKIPFPGVKYDEDQALQFPRIRRTRPRPYDSAMDYLSTEGIVPDGIKYAQVEEAMELLTPGTGTELYEENRSNIKSYSIGHLSETYGKGSGAATAANLYIHSLKAIDLINPYLFGSFAIL